MPRARHHLVTSRLSIRGLVLALFAIASQLGFASAVPRPDPIASIASAGVICHVGPSSPANEPQRPHPARSDCAVCPLCATIGTPAPLLASGPHVAAFAGSGVWRPQQAKPATAVLLRRFADAQPRAPPLFG